MTTTLTKTKALVIPDSADAARPARSSRHLTSLPSDVIFKTIFSFLSMSPCHPRDRDKGDMSSLATVSKYWRAQVTDQNRAIALKLQLESKGSATIEELEQYRKLTGHYLQSSKIIQVEINFNIKTQDELNHLQNLLANLSNLQKIIIEGVEYQETYALINQFLDFITTQFSDLVEFTLKNSHTRGYGLLFPETDDLVFFTKLIQFLNNYPNLQSLQLDLRIDISQLQMIYANCPSLHKLSIARLDDEEEGPRTSFNGVQASLTHLQISEGLGDHYEILRFFPNLESLRLNSNCHEDLINFIAKLFPKLKEFYGSFDSGHQDLRAPIIQFVQNHPDLEKLYLRHGELDDSIVEAISAQCLSLRELSADGENVTSKGLKALESLKNSLTVLKLRSIPIDSKGAISISSLTKLTKLKIGEVTAKDLILVLTACTHLQKIVLNISEAILLAIADHCPKINHIASYLYPKPARISGETLSYLLTKCTCLQSMPTFFKELHYSDGPIGNGCDFTDQSLALYLRRDESHLETLDNLVIDSSRVTLEGLKLIAKCCPNIKRLMFLGLQVRPEHLEVFSGLLKELHFRDCIISDETLKILPLFHKLNYVHIVDSKGFTSRGLMRGNPQQKLSFFGNYDEYLYELDTYVAQAEERIDDLDDKNEDVSPKKPSICEYIFSQPEIPYIALAALTLVGGVYAGAAGALGYGSYRLYKKYFS